MGCWIIGLALRVSLVALLVSFETGCADTDGTGGADGHSSSGSGGDGSGSAPIGGTGGFGATNGANVVELRVVAWEIGWLAEDGTVLDAREQGPGIEGVSVCELDPNDGWMETDNCSLTDSRGRAMLPLPRDQQVAVSMVSSEAHAPWIYAYVTTHDAFVPQQQHNLLPVEDVDYILALTAGLVGGLGIEPRTKAV